MTNSINSRERIADILTEILEKGAYSHVILRQALDKYQFLDKTERAFITRTTDGTLEHLLSIDAILNRYAKTKVEKMKPFIRTVLRMSVYQILFMDRVPDSAVCNEAVKLAVKRKFVGLKGFVNGVLRSVSREKEQLLDELDPQNLQKIAGQEESVCFFCLSFGGFSGVLPSTVASLSVDKGTGLGGNKKNHPGVF